MVIAQTTPKRTWRCHPTGYALMFVIPKLEDSLEAAIRRVNSSPVGRAASARRFYFIFGAISVIITRLYHCNSVEETQLMSIADERNEIEIDDEDLVQTHLPEESPPEDEQIAPPEAEITTQGVVEAVLFASDEPVTAQKLAEIVGAGGVRDIKQHIEQLNQKYEESNCAFRIDAIAGGFQMLTLSQYNVWLQKLLRVRSETKLSPAALETLAIIAYKQPILRVDVEAIRGVGCGEMIRQLCEKGLVKIVGRAEELGRPLLYGTTKKFLQIFGLNGLNDLPQVQELKPPP
jgi:segregation and condensation protein B